MKRLIIYLILMAIAVFTASTGALMQETSRPLLGGRDGFQQNIETPNAMPQSHLNQNRTHKLIINEDDTAQLTVYNELLRLNAIRKEINYGGFKLVIVDHEAAGGLEALRSMQVPGRDDMDFIAIGGYVLDTRNPQAISQAIPADLRQQKMADALRSGIVPTSGLFIVQFEGPIKVEWRAAIEQTGARIVSYMPNNAYIVRADNKAAFGVWQLRNHPFVQYVGDYEPAFKMPPVMGVMRQLGGTEYVSVTVQFIDGPEIGRKIEGLKSTAIQFLGETKVLNYHNVSVTIPASQLTELANDDNVFAIGKYTKRVLMDEAQGQIVAGNLTGNSPSGPGYLAWLASKGFNSSQFRSFAVNVVDDANSLSGHPDLPSNRIAFQNNPTNQTGPLGGHGFFNAQIIGGFNNRTGSAFEDAMGFNYGLGIAPWARVGVTAAFGPNLAPLPTDWEATAYGQGSRISSNSFGLVDTAGNPIAIYDFAAQLYDVLVRDAHNGMAGSQQLAIVFAAGNFGGVNTVSTPGTAKNVITVGASENVRMTGADGCGIGNAAANNANEMASFSSRGPVNAAGGDGRFKPDIVAPGTHIQAGVPQSNYNGSTLCPQNQFFPPGQTLYSWNSGTSHATPAVSGGAALVYQDFLNKGLGAPSPAMIKAVLMNSATYMTGTGAGGNLPSNSQGMGRMNLGRAFDGAMRILVNQTQLLNTTGQVYQISGNIKSSTQPFRVTLAWTDAPGPLTGAPWVNNLDLEVTVGGQTYRGNVFSGANSRTGGTADIRNNVESVFLPAGVSGPFTVRVRATNLAGDGVPGNNNTTDQDFALVIYNGCRR
jgi:subtilisin family serine protease